MNFIDAHFGEIMAALGVALSAVGWFIKNSVQMVATQLIRLNTRVESIDHQITELKSCVSVELPSIKNRVDKLEKKVFE